MQQPVNKDLVKERFTAGLDTYAKEAVVQKAMAAELAALITKHLPRTPLKIFEAGCGSGFLTRELLTTISITDYALNDLVPECEKAIDKLVRQNPSVHFSFHSGDIEELNFGNNYDLITGNAVFQWLTHPVKFWQETAGRLNPDGLVAITLFGEKNFQEITALTGVSLQYPSTKQLEDIFTPYYDLLEIYTTTTSLKFHSGREVLRHIRHTGTSGIKKEHWSKKKLLDFEAAYLEQFGDEQGMVTLTYQPVYLLARVKTDT